MVGGEEFGDVQRALFIFYVVPVFLHDALELALAHKDGQVSRALLRRLGQGESFVILTCSPQHPQANLGVIAAVKLEPRHFAEQFLGSLHRGLATLRPARAPSC